MYAINLTGIVVQSVRAPPCQGGSCGFEPRQSRTRIWWIYQFIFSFSGKMEKWSKQNLIYGEYPYFFCFSFAFLIRQMKFPFIPLVPINKREAYVDWYNQRSRIALFSNFRDTIFLRCSWSMKWNRILKGITYNICTHLLYNARWRLNIINSTKYFFD